MDGTDSAQLANVSPPQGPGGPVDGSGVSAKAHNAWHNMLRTAFVDAPKELKRSAQAREALRQLRHRKGLR